VLLFLCCCSVPWVDDNGNIRVNRGYRVQVSAVCAETPCILSGSAIAPVFDMGVCECLV
jgi:hypothetical protein